MKKILIQLDQFGFEQKLQIHSNNSLQQQSPFGGIMTVILYGLSFAYFVYEIVDWQENNKLPKITQISAPINDIEEQKGEGDIIEYGFSISGYAQINPFDPQNLIVIPMAQVLTNDNTQTLIKLELRSFVNFGNPNFRFVLSDLSLKSSILDAQIQVYQDYQISLRKCSSEYLGSGQKCANESLIAAFFEQPIKWIIIKTYLNQYNTKTRKLETIPKIMFLNLQEDLEQSVEFDMELTSATIDSGILFPSESSCQFFSGYTTQTAQISREQSYSLWKETRYATLYYTLAYQKQKMWIEYPKISEILADAGSIITWILQISFLVYKYNESQLNAFTIEEILKIYYKDFKKLKIKRNWFGRFQSIQIDEKWYDTEKFQQFYEKLSKIAEAKCNFINLLYELSRLQFLLCSGITKTTLKKSDNEATLTNMHELGNYIENQMDELGLRVSGKLTNFIKIIPMSQGVSLEELNQQDAVSSIQDTHPLKESEDEFTLFMKQDSFEKICFGQEQEGLQKEDEKQFDKKVSVQQL